jgi:dethiobiotin synthetase
MRGITILGTDTSVGKTMVSCSLLRVLSFRGWKPLPLKPIETGVTSGQSDARLLLDSAGLLSQSENSISMYRFPDPVAPVLASQWAGVEITKESLLSFTFNRSNESNFIVIETAGGLLSPISSGFSCLDFAVSLGYPVLLVSRNGLGTVSLTTLAVHEISGRGIPLIGIALSTINQESSPDQPFNASLIESNTGIRPLGVFPFVENWPSTDLLPIGLKIFSETLFPYFPI